MTVAFSKLLAGLDIASPFLGPTELQRRRGRPYQARLGANECLFGVSPAVLRVMKERGGEVTFYSDPTHRLLRGALAARWRLPEERFLVAGGIEGLLELFVRAYVDPGDVTVTSLGAFSGFDYFVRGRGGRLVRVPYTSAGTNDLEALVSAVWNERPKLLYLANPDNPTGTQLPPSAISRLLEELPSDCLLILDEAYVEFAEPADVLATSETHPNLVRMRSFSKAYGLAGARIGYAVADAGIIAVLDRIRTHFAVNTLSEEMAVAALEDDAFLNRVLALTSEGRAHYQALAASIGITTLPSAANFVAFDFGEAARAGRVAEQLEARDVFVVRPQFQPLDRLVRVTIAPLEMRERFAAALREEWV